jgi:hypothetical protein
MGHGGFRYLPVQGQHAFDHAVMAGRVGGVR